MTSNTIDTAEKFLGRICEFTHAELTDRNEEIDSLLEPPQPLHRSFHAQGLANWWLPKEYDGAGLGLRQSVDIVSELAYGDAGTAFTFFVPIIATTAISLYGTRALQEQTLKPMGRTGGFLATLGSERAAGSELTNITTTAVRDGDHLELCGEKLFTTNAQFADHLLVIARDAHQQLSQLAIVVPRATPGINIVKRWNTIGLRSAATYQVTFDRCRVPETHVLTGPGLEILEIGLNPSRILIAATAIGIARRIRDLAMDYAKTKSLRETTLIRHPVFAAKLGQMEAQIDVMRNQCLAAADEFDTLMARSDAAQELLRCGALRSALSAKLFCGQTGWQIASTASEMFGGLGYTHEMMIGKLVRDMRHVSIIEGGDDVLRELIYHRFVLPPFKRI
ncbi:acyl-CoA dehydrogenase family protein [Streptomyces chryseus]